MADAAALSALDPAREPVLTALRRLKGRATVADVSAATGLERVRTEQALRALLEERRGHLEVGEAGDLVYRFDPRLISRDAEPFGQRVARLAWKAFQVAFKVWIVAMLLVYFVIFVSLLVAAIIASQRNDNDSGWGGGDKGGRGGGGGRMHLPMGDFWLWYWLWSPDWRRRPYYGERYGDARDRRGRRDGPPFYKKVFAFVFGPDDPTRTREERDREHLAFIRARRGVVSTADFVQYSGMGALEADEELARLVAAHDGEVEVSPDGTLLYTFPELMVSAHGRVAEREPAPAWQRLEAKQPLTGNSAGTNMLVGAINGFNLLMAASAPTVIFPQLGIGGTAAEVALVWVPLVFSATFFGVPLLRSVRVARENAQRGVRNVRRVVLGLVSRAELAPSPAPVDGGEARTRVGELLKGQLGAKEPLDPVLDRLVAEFDGEVDVGPNDVPRFRFPAFRSQMLAAREARSMLALDTREVGEIVYASDDDATRESERALAAFDRELLGAPDEPLRVAVRDERELAALRSSPSPAREPVRSARGRP